MRNRPTSWPDVPMELAQVVQTKTSPSQKALLCWSCGRFLPQQLSFLEWTFYVASTASPSFT